MPESAVTEVVQCVCGKGLICVDVHEGVTSQGVEYRIEERPVPCPACGSADTARAIAHRHRRDER